MLPTVTTQQEFDNLKWREEGFKEAASTIFSGLNRAASQLDYPSSGSLPVILGEDEVVKFFPPLFYDQFDTEVKALKFLYTHGSMVPHVVNVGEIEAWRYVVMSKFKGHSLKELWGRLSPEARNAACFQVGYELRKIHELALSPFEFDLNLWQNFIDTQKNQCFERHKKIGLREDLLNQIPEFLNKVKLNCNHISYLHTEIMRDHVFFSVLNNDPSLLGFIDFEPSMAGDFEYDFASVAVFLTSGDAGALRSFFTGYGNLDQVANKEFRRRAMAFTLLHRYSNLKWYLEFMPQADSLEDLADLWWGLN